MAKQLITARELLQKEIIDRIFFAPSIQKLSLEFELQKTESDGKVIISDLDSFEIKITTYQKTESWRYSTKPSSIFISINNPKNIGFRNSYIEGAAARNYSLEEGRLVFAYGGNTGNPDKLCWEDTFAHIKNNKINLIIGEAISSGENQELERWLKEFH